MVKKQGLPVLVGSAPLVTHSSGCPATSSLNASSSTSSFGGMKSTPVSTPCSPSPTMARTSSTTQEPSSPFAHHSYDLRRKWAGNSVHGANDQGHESPASNQSSPAQSTEATTSNQNNSQTAQNNQVSQSSLDTHISYPCTQSTSSLPQLTLSSVPRKKPRRTCSVTATSTHSSNTLEGKFLLSIIDILKINRLFLYSCSLSSVRTSGRSDSDNIFIPTGTRLVPSCSSL